MGPLRFRRHPTAFSDCSIAQLDGFVFRLIRMKRSS